MSVINNLFAKIAGAFSTTDASGNAVPHDGNAPELLKSLIGGLANGAMDVSGGNQADKVVSLERDPVMLEGFALVKDHRPAKQPYTTKTSALADRLIEIEGEFGSKATLVK